MTDRDYEPSALDQEARLFEAAFLRAHGPLPPPEGCGIEWQPSALAPVFYGVRDVAASGAPVALRVFFPSVDGSVFDAPILEGCGRYPVVLVAHGHCAGAPAEHYKRWYVLPVSLARSGYVVLVPDLPAMDQEPGADHPALDTLADVLGWAREQWGHRDVLLPEPATGIIGHSHGAVLSARFADTTNLAAFASLSGRHSGALAATLPVAAPKLFMWGGLADLLGSSALSDEVWEALSPPKHRVAFTEGTHWSYVSAASTPCDHDDIPGSCRHLVYAAADLVTMFFAKYLPPELSPHLPDRVPDSLLPPALVLTPEQEFFAAGHLVGIGLIEGKPGCEFDLGWETAEPAVPFLRELPMSVAAKRVRDLGLVAKFTGPTGPGTPWVSSQSPAPGTTLRVGGTVTMGLRIGPIP